MTNRISYAQNAEDILVDRYFGDRQGTFMDIGASHPVIDNNTFFFYEHGWRGTNIEPISDLFKLFKEYRPDDLSIQCALSEKEECIEFYKLPQALGLSTFSSEIALNHQKDGFEVINEKFTTTTFDQLLSMYSDQIIAPDLVSIDVEGYEDQIVRSFPFDLWRPEVFLIESTFPRTTTPSHQLWEPVLIGKGYVFVAFNGLNRFYLRDDCILCGSQIFQTPVNYLDNFRRASEVNLERKIIQLEKCLQNDACSDNNLA